MLPKIVPSLWFDGNAEEAVNFYLTMFDDAKILTTSHYPTENLLDFQKHMAGQVLTVDFQLHNLHFTAINAGPEFAPNQSTSFMVNFDPATDPQAREHLDQLWKGFTEQGHIRMELGEYPFSKRYGWVQDHYGFSWQLILTDPEGDPRPAIIPSLLFGGKNQNRAQEALEFYTSALPDAEPGKTVPYMVQTGPAIPGATLFSEFRLWDQWFVAMDSGVDQDFTFNEAVSFVITCRDQEEIDDLWAKLSYVPQAEQCGWCKDQFGVSWQIVPENMDELMARPDAYQHMMEMKKLVIANF